MGLLPPHFYMAGRYSARDSAYQERRIIESWIIESRIIESWIIESWIIESWIIKRRIIIRGSTKWMDI